MRIMLAAALAPLLLACAGPSQSANGDTTAVVPPAQPAQGGGQQVTVELTQGQGSSSAGEQGATAQPSAGGATVRGTMTTPTPCHRLSGAVERTGGAVVLRVSAAADPDAMCIQSIGAVPYTAVIRGLPAGTHEIRVVHTYPGTGWETATVLETRVTVG
jgi:hypothetical protein